MEICMGFTKLDDGILQSSIVGEDSDTFKIWILLLAACKGDEVARVSPVFLSSISKIPMETVMKSLEKLASPDVFSRSTMLEGRRIERVDGGFRVVNYMKYREFSYFDSKGAIRTRRFREKKALQSVTCNDVTLHSVSVSDSVSKDKRSMRREGFIKPLLSDVVAYCCERKNNVDAQKFLDYYESNGWKVGKNPMRNWQAAVRTWEKNAFDGSMVKKDNGYLPGTVPSKNPQKTYFEIAEESRLRKLEEKNV
jgi:hypothetical protein